MSRLFGRESTAEPSFSRGWISQNGSRSRKNVLAVAILNRLCDATVGSSSSFGQEISDGRLEEAVHIVATVTTQDRSLLRHVARDTALLFESLGGLTQNKDAAFRAVGQSGSTTTVRVTQAASRALAVARTIQDRSNDRRPNSSDLKTYTSLFEDASLGGHRRALDVGAWVGTVTARLHTGGQLPPDLPLFGRQLANFARMDGVGWYPNPVNAGDTSDGQAQIERWWDGTDWTERIRIRSGRRWEERQASLLTTPNN